MELDFGGVISPVSLTPRAVAMPDTFFDREMLSRLRAISKNCVDSSAAGRLRIMADEIEQRLGAERRDDFEHGVRPHDQDDDAYAIVRTLHMIALRCFDLSAVGRLRSLADQIEEKIQTSNDVQTKQRSAGH